MEEMYQTFTEKNWTPLFTFTNDNGSSTYDLRRTETPQPKVYAKKIEVINQKSKGKEHKQMYNYYDKNTKKKYNVVWCHTSNNLDGFEEFNSLDEAIESWNLTKVNILPKNN